MDVLNGSSSVPSNSTKICILPFENDQIPLLVLYSIVLIVGLPANIITVYLTFLQVRQKNVLGVFLLSLTACDLMYLGTLPLWAIYVNSGHRWHFSSLACKVTGYIFFNNMYISIFLLCCVSVDRYLAVVYSVESRGLRQRKRAVMVSFIIVMVVALGHMPVFTMTEGETENTDEKRCFEPRHNTFTLTGFNYARFVVGFLIPLFFLMFTNHAIFAKVMASHGLSAEQKCKVRNLALAVILFFLVCFAPYHIILLIRAISFHFTDILQKDCSLHQALYTPYSISLGLSTINSAINPILYVLASDNIRKEIHRSMSNLCSGILIKKRKKSIETTVSETPANKPSAGLLQENPSGENDSHYRYPEFTQV
ncbi:probable G-protein coupled receptor 132 [Trichomycterus rosablanca]|uniref:probable G-protein coupled receptor 132 n=1 Tax=Trichomycterus rosablanca TaxID=2290929 RepID=UPI002F35F579